MYVDINPFLYGFLDVLDELFDQPLVLHVIRDPRDFARSWVNVGGLEGLKRLAGELLPFWLPRPRHIIDQPAKTWRQMPPIERATWYWTLVNNALNRGEVLFGSRYMRLRFEDIFHGEPPALPKMLQWLDRPAVVRSADTRRKNSKSRRNTGPAFDQWPRNQHKAVLSHCGDLASHYGYDIPPGETRRPQS